MKKTISVLTAIMLIMIMGINTIAFAVESKQTKWYVGDVNRDGQVNAVDASIILQHYALTSTGLPSKIYEIAADLNHDGHINAIDASIVLTKYAASSIGKEVEYEIIVEESEYDPKQFGKNDLVQFNGTSWYVHSVMDLAVGNLYPDKEFLTNKEIFVIANKYENNWYGVYLDNTKTEVYILISPTSLEYFNKVGKVELYNPITTQTLTTTATTTTTIVTSTTTTTAVSTSTTSTTTSQLTTSTTNVVSSSTTKTSISTAAATTTAISTTTSGTLTVEPDDSLYSNGKHVNFLGAWWPIHSTPQTGDDNIIGHLGRSDYFYIKKHVSGEWYEIALENVEDTGYIQLEYKYLFNPVKTYTSYYFIGTSWNVRTSMDLSTSDNIVTQLKYGDIVTVTEFYENGWAKIICNKIEGQKELFVVLQPFERLS